MNRILAVFFASAIAMCPTARSIAHAATPAADSTRGAAVFASQSCIQCHALNGIGPKIGPDLGLLVDRGFTPASFASTMWNHAPSMLAAMRARNIPLPVMDEQAAADLFAFFYATRFFEEPGDAGRGKRLFTTRACANCHGITDSKIPAAKPASQWASLADPIAMIEAMWDHASNMRDEMARQKIASPNSPGRTSPTFSFTCEICLRRCRSAPVSSRPPPAKTAKHCSTRKVALNAINRPANSSPRACLARR